MKPHFLLASFYICLNLHAQDKTSIPADSVNLSTSIDMRLYRAYSTDRAFFATEVSKQHLQSNHGLTLFELLQGKISGLDIISASGGPGKNSTAQLRGNLNYTGNAPLIVIDGIPQEPLSNTPFFNTNDVLQNLLPLSPEDILSIEILKNDPSVLLYGADGANGVIYVETRKGFMHKPVFTYKLNQGFVPEPTFHTLLNGDQYIMYQLEAFHNKGITNIPSEIAYDRDFSGFYNYSQNTDWIKAVTQPANSSNHFLNVSGGNKKNLYYGSLNYNNVKGSIINTGYRQLLNRLHFEHNFSKIFTIGADFHYALFDYDDNISINGRDILEMAYIKAPNMSIWEYDSMGNKTGEYFNPINSYQGAGSTYYNPVAVAVLAEKNGRKNQLGGDLILNCNITEWLTFREILSFGFDRVKQKSYLPYNSIGLDWVEPGFTMAEESKVQESFFKTESHLAFNAPFAGNSNHAITGAITWITNSGGGEWLELQSNKNNTIEITDPSYYGLVNHGDEYSWKSRNNGAVINLNYKFKDRYLVTGILRRDAFSFDSDYRNLFKGISAGWRFTEEPWFKTSDFLNNGLIMAGVSSSEYSVYDMTIRSTPSYNVGIRFDALNRIHVDWTYSGRNTESIQSLSGTFNTKNRGWEAGIELEALNRKDINWFLYFNAAHYRCIITDAPENINNWESATLRNGSFPHYLLKNRSLRSIYGLHYEGVYATDEDAYARDEYGNIIYNEGIAVPVTYNNYSFQGGDAHYSDINYDGVINESDVLYLGNSDPKYTGGFGSVIKYRSFSLNVNFHFRLGQKIILQEALVTDGLSTKVNKSDRVLNRWRVSGDQRPGMTPRAYYDHPANSVGSDLYVESGSYVRMNHLGLEYKVKPEWCRKIHISELSFILSAQRLFTFTQSRALDPEVDGKDDIMLYPPKVYTFSVRLGI